MMENLKELENDDSVFRMSSQMIRFRARGLFLNRVFGRDSVIVTVRHRVL